MITWIFKGNLIAQVSLFKMVSKTLDSKLYVSEGIFTFISVLLMSSTNVKALALHCRPFVEGLY